MDLSLDEIISKNRASRRGRGSKSQNELRRTSGGRVQKRRLNDFPRRSLPDKWQHDLFLGNGGGATKGNAKILISNLDYGVNDDDIQELFQEFGVLRRAAVHYDRSGRSLGTAEVIYASRADAAKAIERYNGLPLDGRPMNIQFVGAADGQAQARNRLGDVSRGRQQRGRGGRGGRRGNRNTRPPVTKDQLDAELAAYTAQATTISIQKGMSKKAECIVCISSRPNERLLIGVIEFSKHRLALHFCVPCCKLFYR
ncbi:Aly/REF export factor 2 [Echinococcus granulosus]|uniref:RNA and export factor binding protein 2 n=1 Tax=Echinococcus granulosus TaxID=6210 RepID=A0A068WUC8_ECHGR|nr:Aly/REF export factor 2 [Echinococcus granulosus]CDS23415.1 RNA and export factor binding protein 2 [Echinococcus granulosus]